MKKTVRLGILEGLVSRVPDFLEPMSEDELRLWEGDRVEAREGENDTNARAGRSPASDHTTSRGTA